VSKASDVAYGRRGGRWALDGGQAESALRAIHSTRLQSLRTPTQPGEPPSWPDESLVIWRRLAEQARDLQAKGAPLDDTLARALEVDAVAREAGR